MVEKKIKIILPEIEIDEKTKESIIRKTLKEDFDRGGILAKCLVFIYLNDAVSTTELTKYLRNYYQIEFDRVNVFRAIQRLTNLHLTNMVQSGYIINLGKGERKEIHELILQKHLSFLQNIPTQFRAKFNDVNYVWVSNGEGTKYLKWCSELLNFKYKEE